MQTDVFTDDDKVSWNAAQGMQIGTEKAHHRAALGQLKLWCLLGKQAIEINLKI